jgi:hypothetical protein
VYSKETLKLAELCWSGNEIRSTNVVIGENYTDTDGTLYKIRENTYEELIHYQDRAEKKFKARRVGRVINLIGVQ